MDGGVWTPSNRKEYNLFDGISRSTVQVVTMFVFKGLRFKV